MRCKFFLYAALALSVFIVGCSKGKEVSWESENITIPDPVFLAYCLGAKDIDGNPAIDLDGNGAISRAEAARVEEISLENEGGDSAIGVRSLAGIENFTGLRRLNVGSNSLVSIDLSHNTGLVYLNCADNRITDLNLGANIALQTLNCNQNRLTALDVSALSSLKYLYCGDNGLTALDVSGNPALVELSCGGNLLTSLDVSGCGALTDLKCGVSDLDGGKDHKARGLIASLALPVPSVLVRLDCGANALAELDLAGQDKLSLLRVNFNPLVSLDISPCAKLRTLECVDCELTELDITANTSLRFLYCNGNPDGMTIYVPAGFDPKAFLGWDIGHAIVVER
jgi:Leucine-rich repeat (LRR) protein